MRTVPRSRPVALAVALAGCTGSASARFALENQTAAPAARTQAILADGTSLRLKLIAAYLAEDVGLIYSRRRVDYVAITSSSGACDGASVEAPLLRVAS